VPVNILNLAGLNVLEFKETAIRTESGGKALAIRRIVSADCFKKRKLSRSAVVSPALPENDSEDPELVHA